MPKRTASVRGGGDQEARFLKAFEDYAEPLFRHATLRIKSRDRALDLVHDAYAKAWSYIRDGHEIESFRPFLYKIIHNLIVDEYRKAKEVSLDAILEQEGVDEGDFPDLSESTVEALAATIDGRKAFALVSDLPEEFREVIVMRFVDQLGPKEIAALIEESENTVSVRLHRGLKMLRSLIESKSSRAPRTAPASHEKI
jgi:RNA polymerase sigma-70 factor (ECF subfamily)